MRRVDAGLGPLRQSLPHPADSFHDNITRAPSAGPPSVRDGGHGRGGARPGNILQRRRSRSLRTRPPAYAGRTEVRAAVDYFSRETSSLRPAGLPEFRIVRTRPSLPLRQRRNHSRPSGSHDATRHRFGFRHRYRRQRGPGPDQRVLLDGRRQNASRSGRAASQPPAASLPE